MVTEGGQPFGQRREAVAVGPPLVLLPAGADAELEAAAADDVDRRRRASRSGPGCGTRCRRPCGRAGPAAVTIARAVIVENDSRVISSTGSGTVWKWSKTQIDSKPRRSASRASSTVRAHAAAGSQPSYSRFQPCGAMTPTCIRCRSPGRVGRVAGRGAASRRRGRLPGASLSSRACHDRPTSTPRRPARTARPVGLHVGAEPAQRAAVSHDRHDRGRTGPRRAAARAARRTRWRSGAAGGRDPRGGALRRADRRDGLRHVRARRARGRRDPRRGDARGGRGRLPVPWRPRRSSWPSTRRRAASSSGSRTRAATAATNRALEAARAAGARTAIVTASDRSPGAALADDRRHDRGARPELVPHGRLRLAAPRGRRGRGRSPGRGRGRGRDPARSWPPGPRDTASAEAMAATLADARHLIVIASGRRPDRRPRADPQDRGGGLDPDLVPRPRDVPPRAPAGDRRRRPGSCSSSPTARGRDDRVVAGPPGAGRGRRRRGPLRGDRLGRRGRRARPGD